MNREQIEAWRKAFQANIETGELHPDALKLCDLALCTLTARKPVAWMNPHNGVIIDAKRKTQIGDGNGYPNFSVPLGPISGPLRGLEAGEPVAWPMGWSADNWSAWLQDRSIMLDPYIQAPIMKTLAAFIEDHPKLYASAPSGMVPVPRVVLQGLREQIATEEAGHIAGMFIMEGRLPSDVPQRLQAALQRYAEACLGERLKEIK